MKEKSSANYYPTKRGLKASNQNKSEGLEAHHATKNILKGKQNLLRIGLLF